MWQAQTEDVISDILDDRGWDDYDVDVYSTQSGHPEGTISRGDVTRVIEFTPGTSINKDSVRPEIIEAVRTIEQIHEESLLDQMEDNL